MMLSGVALAAAASPAAAQISVGGGLRVSGGAEATTDYRFRGISQSDGDPALHADVEISHDNGLYVSGFASTLSEHPRTGEVEVALTGGFRRDVFLATELDVGVQLYTFPSNDSAFGATYVEPFGLLSHRIGPARATVGARYAPAQDALGDEDSLYLFADADADLIILPFSITARVGHTNGPARFVAAREYWDWRFGVSRGFGPARVALEYVDTDLPGGLGADSTLVASVRLGF
jgi:uncharacterized protein (TIGR02001 family)